MYTPRSVFLGTFLISLVLSTPLSSNDIIECLNGANQHPSPDDCIHLLSALSELPWTQHYTTFGRNLPEPGRIPYAARLRSCQFVLTTDEHVSDDETATFKLVQSFPSVYNVIEHCFRREARFNEGIVNVLRENKFHVWLSGVPRPNTTILWEGLNHMGNANTITFS